MTASFVDLINALQIGLTITFIILVVTLLRTWGPSLSASNLSRPWTPTNWLAIGIAVGFLFNAFDWSYWMLTWIEVLFVMPKAETFFEYGPVSNLLTRQIPSLFSIYCHLIAAKMMNEDPDSPPRIYMIPLLGLGLAVAVALFFGASFFRL